MFKARWLVCGSDWMDSCLRTTHTQQEALPTLTENIPSAPCISSIRHCRAQASPSSSHLRSACFKTSVSHHTFSPVGCHCEPPCTPERAAAALPCAAVRDLSASAYWDGLRWNFILWISPWNMDSLTLKRNTENIAHCTERQKKAGTAGLAGAKRAPSPASCPQQWLKADSKSKSENKASVCCEFPVHHCFLHCLRYLCILNFFTQVELLQTCLGPISAHFHLKWFIYPIYLFILISFLLQSI